MKILLADKFRELWGEKAGWAQTVMFIDDLKNFEKEKSESLTLIKTESIDSLQVKVEEQEPTFDADQLDKKPSLKRSISGIEIKSDKLVQSTKKKRTKTSV
jgi:hypothetical protein